MAKFEVPLDEAGNPVSSMVAALSARRILINEGDLKTHPFRSIGHAGHRFSAALTSFLNILEEAERAPDDPKKPAHLTSTAFETLCYRAAELFEVYDKLPRVIDFRPNKSLKETAAAYRSAVDGTTRDWSLICNSVKHNSNVIVPVRHTYVGSGISVLGFALCEPKSGAVLDVNKKLHKGRERCRSFNVALRQLIYSLMRCDFVAGRTIQSLPEQDCEPNVTHAFSFDIGDSIKRIADRLPFALREQETQYDGLNLTASHIILRRSHVLQVNDNVRITTQFAADGFTKSFPIV